jgi:ectoine hydroxylase-related dioxygenase (phytanoyl-CoA dioxygenase family)
MTENRKEEQYLPFPDLTGAYDDFRRDGFAVVRGVISPAEVAEMAAAFDRIRDRGLRRGYSYRDGNVLFRLTPDDALGTTLRMVQWPSYFDTVLDRYRTDNRLLRIVAPLLGRDLKQIINQMHWKPPGAAKNSFGFHQDIWFRKPRCAYRNPASAYIQTAIAIDPHTETNGAMIFCRGSHKRGELSIESGGRIMDRDMTAADLDRVGLAQSDSAVLELAPGDVAFWNLYTVHGSGPNVSEIDRRVYLNGYVTAADCDRGEWAFRDGVPCPLGEPVLIHFDDLYKRPYPHVIED